MRLLHAEFLEVCWDELRRLPHYWQTKEDFFQWAKDEPEADARALQTYLTRIDSTQEWTPDNCQIVNVMEDSDWNQVQAGAISFMEGRV